jgi:Ser/Thr protein kinase RdoA (MazF antagonist)
MSAAKVTGGFTESDSDFYQRPTAEQFQRLERMAAEALPNWNAEGSKITPIKYRENAVFAIERPDGERFVLRIHRPGYRSDDQVRSEFVWMQALAGHGLLTPASLPTTGGQPFTHVSVDGVPEPRRTDMLTWIDGSPLGSIEQGAVGGTKAKARNYRTLGEIAARLHDFGASWAPPADFGLPAWDADALVGENPEWGRFWELDCLSDAQRGCVLETRDRVYERLDDFGKAPDRYGLLHGDFLPENILMADGRAHLIDFNDAGTGWYLFEFATSLFFLQTDPDFEIICKALMAGYGSVRAMPVDYERMMPTMVMARGLSYLGWPLSRPEIDEARELAPLLAEHVVELCNAYLADELRIPG